MVTYRSTFCIFKQNVETKLQHSEKIGFNIYLGFGVFSALECLRAVAKDTELLHPERLTSTGYRAYMATISQVVVLYLFPFLTIFSKARHN